MVVSSCRTIKIPDIIVMEKFQEKQFFLELVLYCTYNNNTTVLVSVTFHNFCYIFVITIRNIDNAV